LLSTVYIVRTSFVVLFAMGSNRISKICHGFVLYADQLLLLYWPENFNGRSKVNNEYEREQLCYLSDEGKPHLVDWDWQLFTPPRDSFGLQQGGRRRQLHSSTISTTQPAQAEPLPAFPLQVFCCTGTEPTSTHLNVYIQRMPIMQMQMQRYKSAVICPELWKLLPPSTFLLTRRQSPCF
jgi:hypothetical protein